MGVAILLALSLVLEGIAPYWLLAGVSMGWIPHVVGAIMDIVLHLLDAERELQDLRSGQRRGTAPEARDLQSQPERDAEFPRG